MSAIGIKSFSRVTVSTSAIVLAEDRQTRENVLIVNTGPGTIYLGNNASVSAATGLALEPDAALSDDSSRDAYFAISDSSATVHILETL